MKLSKETLEIFKTLSHVSQYVIIPENSNIIRVINDSFTIFVEVNTKEVFPTSIAFDINKFIGLTSLFNIEKVDIEFNDTGVVFKEDEKEAVIVPIQKHLISYSNYINKNIRFGDVLAEFELSSDFQKEIKKSSSIFSVSNLEITVTPKEVVFSVVDSKTSSSNPTSDKYTKKIKGKFSTIENIELKQKINIDNLSKIYPADYKATILGNISEAVVGRALKLEAEEPFKLVYILAFSTQ